MDNLLRSAVTKICNVKLSDDQWSQASLPVRSGGLGVRSVSIGLHLLPFWLQLLARCHSKHSFYRNARLMWLITALRC